LKERSAEKKAEKEKQKEEKGSYSKERGQDC
jgi:hypothetical protein